MKNTITLFGIVACVAIIGFVTVIVFSIIGFPAKGGNKDSEDITITVTGDFSEYSGWEAYMAIGDEAWAMPLQVGGGVSSLTFTVLRKDNDEPFNKPGAYMVIFWFEKDGEDDADFAIVSKRINEGNNSIEFSSFSSL